MNGEDQADDPRDDPHDAQELDPIAGVSDDPRVDPTPDRRHSDTDGVPQP